MDKKLSVVIITRNRPEDLDAILKNYDLDAATSSRVEIIVVDDHSDDNNLFAAMQTVSDFHSRTGLGRYEWLPTQRMPGGARNRGLVLATGEYVWFVDGDDRVNWTALPQILSGLDARPRLPIAILDYWTVSENSHELVSFAGRNLMPWQLGVMAWHKIIRRDLLCLFDENTYGEDVGWWMRQCLRREMDYYWASGIIGYSYRRLREGSVTATGVDRAEAVRLRVLEELRSVKLDAERLNRPRSFVDHLEWLIKQYE